MRAKLVECSDYKTEYGILTVENASMEAVENKIYEIKREFVENGNDEWTLDDVFEKFPEDWTWNFESSTDNMIKI